MRAEESAVPASVRERIAPQEMQRFLSRSDGRAAWVTAFNLALLAGAFALPSLWLNPLTLLAAVLLIGGRQLGLAVLYHECAHHSFFRGKGRNDGFGRWLFGGLLNTSLARYRSYHLAHHRHAGTPDDPDLSMAAAYPATRASLRRKLIRDCTGQTGCKDLKQQFGRLGWRRNAPFLASHATLLGALALAGIAWAYPLWWVAYLFVYQVVVRIRFMSEHGVAADRLGEDPRANTCTTRICWWERLFIGPNFVNYHLEHHLHAGVPCYRLRAFHRLLNTRGYFASANCLSRGYAEVLRKATLPAGAPAA